MYFISTVTLVLFLAVVRWARKDAVAADFNKSDTLSVRGVLIFFVVIAHLPISFLRAGGLGSQAVAVFLFFSGYGCMKSFKRKGSLYQDAFFKKHLLKLLAPYFVCVSLWQAFNFLTHKIDMANLWVCLQKGNLYPILPHSWFPLALVILYFSFGIAIQKGGRIWKKVFCATSLYYIVVRYWLCFPNFWWVPIWSFPIGICYAENEDFIIKFANHVRWCCPIICWVLFILAFSCLCSFSPFKNLPFLSELSYTMTGVCVAAYLSCGKAGNGLPVLRWLGGLTYEIYLLHGIIFGVICYCFAIDREVAAFLTIASVIPSAWCFKQISNIISARWQ